MLDDLALFVVSRLPDADHSSVRLHLVHVAPLDPDVLVDDDRLLDDDRRGLLHHDRLLDDDRCGRRDHGGRRDDGRGRDIGRPRSDHDVRQHPADDAAHEAGPEVAPAAAPGAVVVVVSTAVHHARTAEAARTGSAMGACETDARAHNGRNCDQSCHFPVHFFTSFFLRFLRLHKVRSIRCRFLTSFFLLLLYAFFVTHHPVLAHELHRAGEYLVHIRGGRHVKEVPHLLA